MARVFVPPVIGEIDGAGRSVCRRSLHTPFAPLSAMGGFARWLQFPDDPWERDKIIPRDLRIRCLGRVLAVAPNELYQPSAGPRDCCVGIAHLRENSLRALEGVTAVAA